MKQKEKIKLWVDALKSGNYKQGISYLNKKNKFCCLGVLCDVVKKIYPEKVQVYGNEFSVVFYSTDGGKNKVDSILPKWIKNWMELNDAGGSYTSPYKINLISKWLYFLKEQ